MIRAGRNPDARNLSPVAGHVPDAKQALASPLRVELIGLGSPTFCFGTRPPRLRWGGRPRALGRGGKLTRHSPGQNDAARLDCRPRRDGTQHPSRRARWHSLPKTMDAAPSRTACRQQGDQGWQLKIAIASSQQSMHHPTLDDEAHEETMHQRLVWAHPPDVVRPPQNAPDATVTGCTNRTGIPPAWLLVRLRTKDDKLSSKRPQCLDASRKQQVPSLRGAPRRCYAARMYLSEELRCQALNVLPSRLDNCRLSVCVGMSDIASPSCLGLWRL